MPRIRCLIEYLRPVSDALSYEHYDHPERIVSLLWAKENIDILSDKESLEKELSQSVTMPDMGGNLQFLKIKEREKVRVCHLINQLWRQLRKEVRDEWLSEILDSLGISRKFYNSKYSISPREYDRSKASNTFCSELSEIFSKAEECSL